MMEVVKEEWKKVRLGEVCEKITDGSHWSPKSSANGIPMVSVKDMTDFGFNIKIAKRISIENYKKLVKNDCKPLIHDVLIAKDGSYLKHIFVWREDIDIALLSSIAILRPDLEIIYPEFLKYTLQSPDVKNMMKNYVTGAALPRIILEDFKKFEIEIPPLPIQRKIAAILSGYDDLVENNSRRIKILEEMAQTIYKEWFVKFRFPGYEKVKLMDSELGQIPDGWVVKRLGEIVELAYGKALKKDDRRNGSFPVYGSGGVVGYHDEYLVQGPGIIVGRKGNVGRVFWSQKSFYPIDTVFFVKTNVSLYYLYYNLKEQNFVNTDAAVPGLSRNQAYLNKFLLPPDEILHLFAKFIFPIFSQTEILHSQIENLRRTRDFLLPKLISGEIDMEVIEVNLEGLET